MNMNKIITFAKLTVFFTLFSHINKQVMANKYLDNRCVVRGGSHEAARQVCGEEVRGRVMVRMCEAE